MHHLETLSTLDRAHETRRVIERVERSCVQPCGAAGKHGDPQSPLLEVPSIEIGDLEVLARRARFPRHRHRAIVVIVVEVQSRGGEVALGFRRFLLQRRGLAVLIELDHSVRPGVQDRGSNPKP